MDFSKSLRTGWIGRDLKVHKLQHSNCDHSCHPLDHVAQGSIQLGLRHLQSCILAEFYGDTSLTKHEDCHHFTHTNNHKQQICTLSP